MNIKTKICVQKWQLEHHNVSNYCSSVPIISTICGKNCIFLFSLNQLRPKLHTKFFGRNLETRESPNLRKYPIVPTLTISGGSQDLYYAWFVWLGRIWKFVVSHGLNVGLLSLMRIDAPGPKK